MAEYEVAQAPITPIAANIFEAFFSINLHIIFELRNIFYNKRHNISFEYAKSKR